MGLRHVEQRGVHLERGQPKAREHLGLLEKKKDHRKRAAKAREKAEHIRKLREAARGRNVNEFNYRMITSKNETRGVLVNSRLGGKQKLARWKEERDYAGQGLADRLRTGGRIVVEEVGESGSVRRLVSKKEFAEKKKRYERSLNANNYKSAVIRKKVDRLLGNYLGNEGDNIKMVITRDEKITKKEKDILNSEMEKLKTTDYGAGRVIYTRKK